MNPLFNIKIENLSITEWNNLSARVEVTATYLWEVHPDMDPIFDSALRLLNYRMRLPMNWHELSKDLDRLRPALVALVERYDWQGDGRNEFVALLDWHAGKQDAKPGKKFGVLSSQMSLF